ncbi:golgin subfamily B member 1-like isoform X3 [Scaptodrosophila lebanonensis]|uniref:Golgin subfamily B member 1-like isoform X3 n=1 Tax=Drosophila lebanonensis TaxID=7225 RepID=A0A6J2TAU5_DROLE|nr:golgin subfamily B member 1-like isoform X3 [Scaptodrosophila lebanonensis]
MAENTIETTSSKGLEENSAHILTPHNGAVRKLAPERGPNSKQSFQANNRHENVPPVGRHKEDWETIVLGKNKLKRKKKLSASLTSVGDTVNQEKRTRIEGIQLNCRGKLRPRDTNTFEHSAHNYNSAATKVPANKQASPTKKVERPVLVGGVITTNVSNTTPQRFKRKMQESLDTIQKLNALTEQLRLEINELKSSLITERSAVRALRAQNDADGRKWRAEVKKLQKSNPPTPQKKAQDLANGELSTSTSISADGLINYEIQRLTNEIAALKEANRTKEEKCQLEEIKTKERNIGQLKKDLQVLHNSKKQSEQLQHQQQQEKQTKISTTKTKTNEKPKKPTNAIKTKNETDTSQAQVTSEITQLKNIELINNTKNVQKSLEMRTTKSQNGSKPPNTLEEMSKRHEQLITTDGSVSTWMTTTKCRALPQDVVCALFNKATAQTQTQDTQEYRPKDNNSDTDSALSSAPPSISPQPPSTGSDSGVMWQTMHTYSKDLEKLQKEVEMYHKENERLQTELQLMKQELVTAEKAALEANNNAYINELLERIKKLEEHELKLTAETNELREQNELLEFRILELEDDKTDDSCEGQCQRLQTLLQDSILDEKDKRGLQQLLQCVQQLHFDMDFITDLESAKSEQRLITTANNNNSNSSSSNNSPAKPNYGTVNNRIVATVQPYNNSASGCGTPQDSPRKLRQAWQSNSLSESGVFVECDFAGEPLSSLDRSTGTQTEVQQQSLEANDFKRLQYYKERLELLERKVLIYESSGDIQAKHLADRLQREVQLEKELKELTDRVECLLHENSLLEEEKCEFEEADNDSRLRLQRTEVELEILRQRNVELEFSKEALGAKYKDCRAECIILREDLGTFETQVRNLEADRQRAKQHLVNLRRSLPLFLLCRLWALARMGNEVSMEEPRTPAGSTEPTRKSPSPSRDATNIRPSGGTDNSITREVSYLKEEVKSLRCQMKDLNTRHYEAMETADSHWVDLEREYKQREEAYRAKEACLKQKIARLQDCLREDSRAAAEKIQQLEETEQGLKTCLVRLTKEHRDLLEEHKGLQAQIECNKAQQEQEAEEQRPLAEALENEKRRSQALIDDLSFSKKLQQNTEEQLKQETDTLRQQIFDMKKEFLHIEVTNGELKEEVGTLECKICEMLCQLKAAEDREHCLEDELRTKEEYIQELERKMGTCPEGFSLADELFDSPAKRARREEIQDLQSASQGLGCALRDLERRERELPTHRDFQAIACGVKQLADTILYAQNPPEEEKEVSGCQCMAEQAEDSACAEKLRSLDEATNKAEEAEKTSQADSQPFASVQSLTKSQSATEQVADEAVTEAVDQAVDQAVDEAAEQGAGEATVEEEPVDQPVEKPKTPSGSSSPVSVSKRGSTLSQKSRRKSRRSSGGGGGVTYTVGMALIPPIVLSTYDGKKELCEVPTEMRQLIDSSGTELEKNSEDISETGNVDGVRRKRRTCKQFNNRRVCRGRVRRSSGTMGKEYFFDATGTGPLRKSLSYCSFHSLTSMHSVRSVSSALSMNSLHAEFIEWPVERLEAHAFVQTELETESKMVQVTPDCCDQEVLAKSDLVDLAMQSEEASVEHRLMLMPLRTRGFVELLQRCVQQEDFDSTDFRARLLHLWETSEEFREHIELLQDLCMDCPRPHNAEQLESYDKFVAVLGCVRALKFAMKPFVSQLLNEIEEKINGRLIRYHNHKVESEFYCTIYYPVERRNNIQLTDSNAQ